ncbi:MAG: glutamate synthase subunit alpha, partial [Anaerolineae bacterium]|nr:glutamate synthase subunit alpha [Anaerolineae bacterium]
MMQHSNQTLYRPEFEHDSCGVGFIARTTGQADYEILAKGLEAVGCMKHRAGVDADGRSGDGAGITTQIPHAILAQEFADLPAAGDYALGTFFLPNQKTETIKLVEDTVTGVLAETAGADPATDSYWRDIPLDHAALGYTAARTCPNIRHLIIHRPASIAQGRDFERFLFTLRNQLDTAASEAGYDGESFHVASLSSRTVVYKGLMLSPNLADFYLDLANPDFATAFAVFHTRYSTNTTSAWSRAQPFRQIAHNGEIN